MAEKERLEFAMEAELIVRVYREHIEDGWAHGFVVGVGDQFFALQEIDNHIRFDGYDCLRLTDITECSIPDPYSIFYLKALEARGLSRPPIADIDVSSLRNLISSIAATSPLMTISTEEVDDEDCYIGSVVSLSDDELELIKVTPHGEWETESETLSLKDITRIEFGGAYEEALSLVAGSIPHR